MKQYIVIDILEAKIIDWKNIYIYPALAPTKDSRYCLLFQCLVLASERQNSKEYENSGIVYFSLEKEAAELCDILNLYIEPYRFETLELPELELTT